MLDHRLWRWLNIKPAQGMCFFTAFNPYAAEILRTIFHSFEAGIANAISSSKWRKNIYVHEKMYFFKI